MTGCRPVSPTGLAAAVLLAVAAGACGGGDAEREADVQAAIEQEFGRRDTAAETPGAPSDAGSEAEDQEAPGSDEGPAAEGTAGAPATDSDASGAGTRETSPDAAPPPASPPTMPSADPTAVAAVDVDSLLAAAERAYSALRTLRAGFLQRTENRLLERTREGMGRWYQAGRDRFLMDFTDPPEDVYVADGEFLWVYQPSATPGQVIKSELARNAGDTGTADLLGQILREARTSYDGVLENEETVSGVETWHVALTPRGSSRYVRVDVWIAARDALVRRFRIEEENETVRTVTLTDLEPNVPLADSLFRFTPPAGVTVFTP